MNQAVYPAPRPGAHFCYGGSTGLLPAALAANSEIFQFRWTSTTAIAAVRRVRVSASCSTILFDAGVPVEIDMVKATGWTSAGTGGTAIAPSTTLRMGASANSLVASGDARKATTAALGAGTKVLEANSISSIVVGGPITLGLNGGLIPVGTILFERNPAEGDRMLELRANEGFSIRSVAVPGTGTWRVSFIVEWDEIVI